MCGCNHVNAIEFKLFAASRVEASCAAAAIQTRLPSLLHSIFTASSTMASAATEENLGDDISVTSADDENEDSSYELANRILAEKVVGGKPVYLTEWHASPSLADATWEPRGHLEDGLMAEWERIKRAQRKGLKPKFRIQKWREACIQKFDSRLSRHVRRNANRERCGLPQTEWGLTRDKLLQRLAVYADSDDDDEVGQTDASSTRNKLHRDELHENTSSSADLLERETLEQPARPSTDSPRQVVQEKLAEALDEQNAISPSEKPSLDPPAESRSRDARVTTQGSTKQPKQSSGISREVRKTSSRSHRAPIAGSAKYDNVFVGGRSCKGRGTISEAASNPETHPKFLNSHLQRKIELQRRDREGMKAPAHRPPELISLDPKNPLVGSSGQAGAKSVTDEAQASGKSNAGDEDAAHCEDEPAEIDPKGDLSVSGQAPSPTTNAADAGPDGVDGAACEEPLSPRVIRTVQLGPDDTNTVTLSFDAIPVETVVTWAMQFRSNDRLVFTHTCTTQDFSSQVKAKNAGKAGLPITRLSEGNVMSITENDTLKNLVNHLRLGPFGMLCRTKSYCVLIFFVDALDRTTGGSQEATLKYTIFTSVDSLGPSMLAPAPQLTMSGERDGERDANVAFDSRSLDRIFGLKYEDMIPDDARNAEKHNFFLAFPPRAKEEAALLSRWLRSCHSNSDIRSSCFPGHWASFLRLRHGVVIIHEDALWFIRLFPEFDVLLHRPKACFTFWGFNRSLLPVDSFASGDPVASPLGDIHLQRVFRPSIAFLLTPSFFVSEPINAYSFIKFFYRHYVESSNNSSAPGKLVLCARVDEWMHDLNLEKAVLRDEQSHTASKRELDENGLSDTAMDCRQKTLKRLRQLMEISNNGTSKIVFAPESIDGNDEQSLVNWFGYWSILHMDQFRRYVIVGSERQRKIRRSRLIRTPNYQKTIINDPDELQSDRASQPGTRPATPSSAPGREYGGETIASRLSEVVEWCRRTRCSVVLYRSPVACSTLDVAFRAGDIISKYHTYDQWFNSFWKGFEPHKMVGSAPCSIAGLFYTVDEHQRATHSVQRQPWVAVFRPINMHRRPWNSSELLIWDSRYCERIRQEKHICHSDLLEAQQRLIEDVRRKTGRLLPLENVWVGAFGAQAAGPALEVTIQWLEIALRRFKDWMPVQGLPSRGWSLVSPERQLAHQGNSTAATDADDGMANLQLEEDDASPPKIIFHPPSGNGLNQYTKCRNRLYQCAREADPTLNGKYFDYVFRPTMHWYDEQCEEGRGFAHIKVMEWGDVFKMYNIQ